MIFLIPLLWNFCASSMETSFEPARLLAITNNTPSPIIVAFKSIDKKARSAKTETIAANSARHILGWNLGAYKNGSAWIYDSVTIHYDSPSNLDNCRSYILPAKAGEHFELIVTGVCSIQRKSS